MKILIVDDNTETRRLIRSVVGKHSHSILEAENGPEAIALYAENRPDWVLMDIEMQGMDGITAVRNITKDHPEARIIVVTMHDSPRLRSEAREAGAVNYVLKDQLTELFSILSGG